VDGMDRTKRRGARTGLERGSVLVEAAMLLPILLVAVFGIVEFGRFFYTKIAIENATREAGRFAVTGNMMADPGNPTNDMARPDGIRQYLVDQVGGIEIDKAKITIDPSDGGGPSDIVKISVEYKFDFAVPLIAEFFPNGAFTIEYTTVMKNEPIFTEKRRS
jgi:hypothetical protein